jgi:excisionase family DNA binding protein
MSAMQGIETDVTDTRALAAELAALIGREAVSPLLDAGQAAALLNVPPSWLLAQARAARVPHVRLGRYVRFHREELLAWAQGRQTGPRPHRRER